MDISYVVLNDPTHICTLPDPGLYPKYTHVQCEEIVPDGLYADGRCGKKYTRTETFFSRTPRWSKYDFGW